MATQQEVIQAFMSYLRTTTKTGTSALDVAVRYASKFNSLDDLKTQFLSDIRTANDGNTFLEDYAGIILDNTDTGAITGADAGNGTVKTASSVVFENSNVSDWEYVAPGSTLYLSNGMRVNLPSTREDGSALTSNDLFILKAIPHWLEASIALIEESFGFAFDGTACDVINIKFGYEKKTGSSGWLAEMTPDIDPTTGKAYETTTKINLYYYSNLNKSDVSGIDTVSGEEELDRTLVHEIVHAVMAANDKLVSLMPAYITEGMAELVHGVDDTRSAIISLASDANLMSQALTSANWTDYPTVTSGNATLNAPCYAGGYTLLRYMAKQSADSYVKRFTGTSAADNFETRNDGVTIVSWAGNDTITNYGASVSIDAGLGNDFIRNQQHVRWNASTSQIEYMSSPDKVTINASTGNDSIWNGGNKVSINGGTGNDSIYNSEGSYTTIDGGAGDDDIYNWLNGNNTSIDGGTGNDSIGNSASGVTINGGAGDDTISSGFSGLINGDDGNDYIYAGSNSTIYGGDGNDSIENWYNDSVTIDGGAGNDYIYNDWGDGATIDGGAGNDSIVNYGNNVTISGGTGNDTIINKGTHGVEPLTTDETPGTTEPAKPGEPQIISYVLYATNASNDMLYETNTNTHANVYVYNSGDGNDLIQGFNDNDTLSIGGSYSTQKSGKDIIVTVGDGKITLQGAASLSSVNINGINDRVVPTVSPYIASPSDKFIDASTWTKPIKITGNSLNNSIVGGKAADTLNGVAGNDTLTGGWGADTFVYTGGKDVITDYGANFDKVSLAGDGAKWLSHITGVSVKNNNVTLTFNKDSNKTLTINNAAGKKVIVNGATRIFGNNVISTGDKQSATLTSGFSGTFNAKGYKGVNASAVTQAVTISGANSIVGGSKADSLVGTTGNDTLTGGYGADTFVYTGGKDVITDYAANFDKIVLNGTGAKWLSNITGVSVKNSNVTLTFSNDSNKKLTLNGAAGKKVIVNNTTLIFENGRIYNSTKTRSTVASAAADGYWFDEHDFTQGAQLDSLMETSAADYSLGKLETTDNLTKLTQGEFLLTYGDDKK